MLRRLEKLPERSETFLVADYVELRTLFSLDGEYSASDLQADRRRERDLARAEAEPEPMEEPAPEEAAEVEPHPPEERAEEDADDLDLEGIDVWSHLEYRAATFDTAYPFVVSESDEGRALQLLPDLTNERRLYIVLLLASSLRYVSESAQRATLTKTFELMAVDFIQAHLPVHAEVNVFGTSSGPGSRYRGNLLAKYEQLAQDLDATLLVGEDDLDPRNTGDGGLDVVAWIPMGDDESRIPVLFAQCGCGKDWLDKQAAVTEVYWSVRLALTVPLLNLMLIPYCYRRPSGKWFSRAPLARGVLFDRLRIMRAVTLGPLALPLAAFPSDFADQALAFKLDPTE